MYYYLTVMNENYSHPDLPGRVSRKASSRACTCSRMRGKPKKGEPRVQLLGSGTILREVIAAAELLEKDFGVKSDIWSCPSFIELRRDGFDAERWNRLHPESRAARAVCHRSARRSLGPGDRRDRLRARVRRPDPRVHARRHALHRAGYRRLRSFGHACEPARVLRGRSLLDRPRRAGRAGEGRQDESPRTSAARSRNTSSTRTSRTRSPSDPVRSAASRRDGGALGPAPLDRLQAQASRPLPSGSRATAQTA